MASAEQQPSWCALIADDDDDSRALMASALRRADIEVLEAADGEQLLDTFRALSCKSAGCLIVISDIQMPGKDGIAATRELRAEAEELPVVLVTGSRAERALVAAYDAGASAVLLKPLTPTGLLSAVERWRADGLVEESATPEDCTAAVDSEETARAESQKEG